MARQAPGAVRGGIARDVPSVLFGGARRRRRIAVWLIALGLVGAIAGAVIAVVPADARPALDYVDPAVPWPPITWRTSRAMGETNRGRLVDGVLLPVEGPDFFTWNPVWNVKPNRRFRRWGTDTLVRTTLDVLREYRLADPAAPRAGIMDLSRHHGGEFGPEYGGLGHASHQNGLDVDIAYPRRDGLERRPLAPQLVDRGRAQDLVDRFVAGGAEKVFVGPALDLRGPKKVVIPLIHHDDHLHVRIPPPD